MPMAAAASLTIHGVDAQQAQAAGALPRVRAVARLVDGDLSALQELQSFDAFATGGPTTTVLESFGMRELPMLSYCAIWGLADRAFALGAGHHELDNVAELAAGVAMLDQLDFNPARTAMNFASSIRLRPPDLTLPVYASAEVAKAIVAMAKALSEGGEMPAFREVRAEVRDWETDDTRLLQRPIRFIQGTDVPARLHVWVCRCEDACDADAISLHTDASAITHIVEHNSYVDMESSCTTARAMRVGKRAGGE
jgi:hypothetical protein